jgi:S-adenosylmethionine:tRNA ribosyltransferase-isomerase
MDRSAFNYDLPPDLIAQTPLAERSASRLLMLDGRSGEFSDRRFAELPALLAPGDLLVFNDTRVLPARLHGTKATGGRVELLLDRITGARAGRFQIRASHGPKPGSLIALPGGTAARVVARTGDLYELELDVDFLDYLREHGEVPLPPYIARAAEPSDRERYQTVFAVTPGAVAAPTAGLHFDRATFAALAERGIEHAFLTLHVGAGTFAPLRTERLDHYELHAEWMEVGSVLCDRIRATQARGGRVVAVGTTAARALETAACNGSLAPFSGETRLFIQPGYRFRVVDVLVTNFHLPESSLLVLAAAFAGLEPVLRAYRHAVAARYRFFSYGDAMLIFAAGSARTGDSRAV